MIQLPGTTHESAILERVLQPSEPTFTPAVAHAILTWRFGPPDVERMNALAAKAREGTLTPAETEEINSYERVGTFLAILQSKARQSLKRAGHG